MSLCWQFERKSQRSEGNPKRHHEQELPPGSRGPALGFLLDACGMRRASELAQVTSGAQRQTEFLLYEVRILSNTLESKDTDEMIFRY